MYILHTTSCIFKLRFLTNFFFSNVFKGFCKVAYRNCFNSNNKRVYIQTQISGITGNNKEFWNLVKILTGDKRNTDPIPNELSANSLNNYFATIGESISSNFNQDLPNWKCPESIFTLNLEPINPAFVLSQLKTLPNKPKLDICGIDSKLLRIAAELIFLSLTQIYNLSILQSKVLTDWKKGKISPINKGKGTKSDPSNYRPISVLPHLSKIIEKHVNSV